MAAPTPANLRQGTRSNPGPLTQVRGGGGVAVLSPHPDDAVLSAWATLRAGAARVCNVCTAVPPRGTLSEFDRLFGVDDSSELFEMRLAEDAAALAVAGCTDVVSLGFLDDQYRSGPIPAVELRSAIDAATAGSRCLCAPAGIGAHPDHVAVRDAAIESARERGMALELYADLPYAVHFGWPSWVTGRPPRPFLVPDARWAADLAATGIAAHELTPHAIALGADEQALKGRALECYRSQFAALDAGPLGRISHPEVIGYEVRWRVNFS